MGTEEAAYRVNNQRVIVEDTNDPVIEEIITYDWKSKKRNELLVFEKQTGGLLMPNRA